MEDYTDASFGKILRSDSPNHEHFALFDIIFSREQGRFQFKYRTRV